MKAKTSGITLSYVLLLTLTACNVTSGVGNANRATVTTGTYILRTVGRDWDFKTFDSYTDPAFYKYTNRAQTRMFLAFVQRKLGPLRAVSLTRSSATATVGTAKPVWECDLRYSATFHSAKGTIDIELLDHGKGWHVKGLQIYSPGFMR